MSEAPSHGAMGAKRAADGDVVPFDLFAVAIHHHSPQADVGDPVLAARVRAAGGVELDVGAEARHARLQLPREPDAEPPVSVMASLENSDPVHETVPR